MLFSHWIYLTQSIFFFTFKCVISVLFFCSSFLSFFSFFPQFGQAVMMFACFRNGCYNQKGWGQCTLVRLNHIGTGILRIFPELCEESSFFPFERSPFVKIMEILFRLTEQDTHVCQRELISQRGAYIILSKKSRYWVQCLLPGIYLLTYIYIIYIYIYILCIMIIYKNTTKMIFSNQLPLADVTYNYI